MIDQRGEVREGRPFLRTLHGGAGVPGSEVVTNGSGKVYKLGRQVGSSGNVFELQDSPFAEPVVIKLFPRAAGIDERAINAFAEIALRSSGLGHPHIARVFDAGSLENGTPFLVVERLSGETLLELLSRRAALPVADSLAILRAIGGALSAAHLAGFVHGEVRPDNVFIVADGRRNDGSNALVSVKLLDFGAALLTAPLRQMGMIGNDEALSYLGPEQLRLEVHPEEWDGRVDEYAVAVLTHRLLVHSEARRSPALTAVISMAMNQQPGDRFISVEQFINALEEVVVGAVPPPASAPAREALKPLGDLDITPMGGGGAASGAASYPVAGRTPAGRESSRSYGALTRQFFEDGNRMSEEASAARLRRPSSSFSMSAVSMRVPTSGARKVAVVLGALAAVGLIAAGWAGVWNPVTAMRTRARVLFSPRPSAVSASLDGAAVGAPAAADRPPAPVAASQQPAAVAAKVAPASAPAAAARVPAVDRSALEPATRAQASQEPAKSTEAGTADSTPSAASRSSRRARPATRWSDPLHGYVWSPAEQRLVPSEGADARPPAAATSPAPARYSTISPSSLPAPPSPSVPSPPSIPSPPAPVPGAVSPVSASASAPPSSSLLDRPMPMSSSSSTTEPPPQPAPPVIDDSVGPKASAATPSGAVPR